MRRTAACLAAFACLAAVMPASAAAGPEASADTVSAAASADASTDSASTNAASTHPTPVDAAALDLVLPKAASPLRNDPPGTWYGDTSGVPANPATAPTIVRRACPTAPDGRPTDVTGSVRAGIGYSSQGGNSNWQGASLNYCKTYANEDGKEGMVNMQLHVDQYDGPLYAPFYGPMPGPGPWGGGGGMWGGGGPRR